MAKAAKKRARLRKLDEWAGHTNLAELTKADREDAVAVVNYVLSEIMNLGGNAAWHNAQELKLLRMGPPQVAAAVNNDAGLTKVFAKVGVRVRQHTK